MRGLHKLPKIATLYIDGTMLADQLSKYGRHYLGETMHTKTLYGLGEPWTVQPGTVEPQYNGTHCNKHLS